MASMVMTAPSFSILPGSAGMAAISLDSLLTLTWANARGWRAAKAQTVWIGSLAPFFDRSAQGFAVNRDDFGRRLGQGLNPVHKAGLERLRVERGKDIAKGVTGRGSIGKGTKAPQQLELFNPKADDSGEAVSPGQHGRQCQQQPLRAR